LRYAIRAYAAQGDEPDAVLTKLSGLLSVGRDGFFATVLCGLADVPTRTVTLANAGHPAPLLLDGDEAIYVDTLVGRPVGVAGQRPYECVTVTIPPRGALLAFTDGLVERRGESLDAGFSRLRAEALSSRGRGLDEVVEHVIRRLAEDAHDDDTAILGLQWRS
jgi:serine phosphatase RsbU (regulator of sigma subunit)